MVEPKKEAYLPRYIEKHVKKDLARKMVFVARIIVPCLLPKGCYRPLS
ncbi:MAG: hypothetical protein JRI51_11000 [Deltaproteobacteria bacterium]|nr:hypothetical protein [Deltaproteobacteria bacterium]